MEMALGFNLGGGGGGGDFLPIIKYDARAGRLFRVDREDGVSAQVDITRNFKAVFDFENVETGWIKFAAGSAPDFRTVPLGSDEGDKPSDEYKHGLRMCVKLGAEVGGDCRELAGTSVAFLGGVDALHDLYMSGVKTNAGKLPVVVLDETVPIESGSGSKKSTNYRPVFSIAAWVSRPKDLVASSRSAAPAASPSTKSTPPATGSTRADPPARKAAPVADEEEFG
jgi:hypothetical protein